MTMEKIHEMTNKVYKMNFESNEFDDMNCFIIFNRITMHHAIVGDEIIIRAFEMIQNEKKLSDEIIEEVKALIEEDNKKKRRMCEIFGLYWTDNYL